MAKEWKKILIRVTPTMLELAKEQADEEDKSLNQWIREAIRDKAAKQPQKDFEKRVIKVVHDYHNREGAQG